MPDEQPPADRPVRPLHLISSSGLYGAETMVVALCRRLADLGAEPVLVVFENRHAPNLEVAEHAQARGVAVRTLPCRGRFDPSAVRRLAGIVRENRSDLVHTHGFKANLYGYLATRRAGLPIVATVHRFDRGRYNTFDGPLLRRFDAVMAVSREAEELVNEVYGIPASRTATIPNGIDAGRFSSAVARERPDGAPAVIGMVARLAPEKAPGDLLEAARLVLEGHPTARFVFAGDGPLREELEVQAHRLGISGSTEFLGFCDDIAAVYREMDVLVQPSYREGMPMTMLEAMASGLPVVATRVGAATAMIDDGRTGLLVRPGDIAGIASSITRLIEDVGLRRTLGQRARSEVMARFTDTAMAQAYLAAYRKVLRDSE